MQGWHSSLELAKVSVAPSRWDSHEMDTTPLQSWLAARCESIGVASLGTHLLRVRLSVLRGCAHVGQSDLAAVAKECFTINPKCRVLSFPLDVADTEMLKAAVTSTVTQCGTLSAVISNAGVNRRRSAALCSDSGRVWEQVTAVNLLAGMHLTRFALPHLMRHAAKASRRADTLLCFVNTHCASRACCTRDCMSVTAECVRTDAQPTQQRLPGASIYVTTKTGLAGFAQAVMEDVRDMGIKVVTLFPGLVNTRLGRAKGPIERKYACLAPATRACGGYNIALCMGTRYNNAAQQPEDMIQCSDLMYAIRYAPCGCYALGCVCK